MSVVLKSAIDRALTVDIVVIAVQMGQKESIRIELPFSPPRIGGENVESLEKRRIKILGQCRNLRLQDIEDILNRIYRWQGLC